MSSPAPDPLPLSAPPCLGPAAEDPARWFQDQVHVHDGQLKSYLRGAYPSVRDVDDVVQESYLKLWKARASRPILSAKAYLFRIARNVALDLLHQNARSPIDPLGNLADLRVIDSGPSAA